MRLWRALSALLLCLVLAGSVACNPLASKKVEPSQQLVNVKKGDLIISVSGSGNVGVANEIKLAFGVGGRVERIYVEEGDRVTKGEVLARLKIDDLELAVTEAKGADAKAQVAVTQAQVAVTQAQVSVTQTEVARQTAELELKKSQNLYKWPDLEIAQVDVEKARLDVEYAQKRLDDAPDDQKPTWALLVARAEGYLFLAEENLNAMLASADTDEVAIKKRQVEASQQSLNLAQQSRELAQQSLNLAQQSRELTQQSLKRAQQQLDEAVITAPFDGTVASVYADEGDIIPSPTMGPKTIIHLIDLTSMELKIEVDEIDIPGVKPGQKAIIEVDALPTLPLEGKVTYISPLSKEEAGVVLYEVKISFNVSEDSGLKAGMSADADIVISERSNVLLVPSRAITKDSEGNSVVKVMVDKRTQERPVVIGLSDDFETEIIKGLSESDVVLVESRAK